MGVMERRGVGPCLAEGVNETLGVALSRKRVCPGANVLELENTAGFGKGLAYVGQSVITHHLTTLKAMTVKPSQ